MAAEFKVPKLPLRRPVIGPMLPPSTELNPDNPSTAEEHEKKKEKLSEDDKVTTQTDEPAVSDTATNDGVSPDVSDEIPPRESRSTKPVKPPPPDPPNLKLAYSEPLWGGRPLSGSSYQLMVIKNGIEIGSVDLSDKSFCLCGRLPSCDIHLEHPSISRHHAILQYRPHSEPSTTTDSNQPTPSSLFSNAPREAGFYVYDLGSTHGTFLTKNKLQPRCYYRMRVGQSVKFGGSSRLFVLDQGSSTGQEVIEAEAEQEIAEITRKKEEYDEYVRKAEEEEERRIKEQEEMGATWGMVMDDMPPGGREPQDMWIDSEREAYYISDPKKALKTFFDREGLDLEYENEESGPNHSKTYTIKVWLPIYTSTGEPVYASGSVKGNKKAAVVECALEACRLLDAEGILRESTHSHKKNLKTLEENDYYDSDEDNFLDRTGDVERKRKRRMIRAGKINETVETYQSLMNKLSGVQAELVQMRTKLQRHKESSSYKGDSLDDYMKVLSGQLDSSTVSKIKLKIQQLQKEETKLTKLVKVAMPYQLPGSKSDPAAITSRDSLVTAESQSDSHTSSGTSKREQDSSRTDELKRSKRKAIDKTVDSLIEDVSSEKKATNYGLILPSDLRHKDGGDNDGQQTTEPCKKKRRQRMMGTVTNIPKGGKKDIDKDMKWSNTFDPEFASWIPPEDQTGDGKTSLNEKLGY